MKTYNDFLSASDRELFITSAIAEHKGSSTYRTALDAIEYDAHRNVTINKLKKVLYTVSGSAVPDNISANYKLSSNFFHRFVVQQVQYLLGNGVMLEKAENKKKLGKDFDTRLSDAAYAALLGGVSFGFWNYDRLQVFSVTEFVPLYDERTGVLMAGLRFWQVSADKPMYVTLYEPDGYTEYEQGENGKLIVSAEKRAYILNYVQSPADGLTLTGVRNYSSLPIVPLKGNRHEQSELVGLRENIDCYDLIKSGFANDLDDASQIYWTLTNTGGMDDVDIAEFIQRLKTVKAAVVDSADMSAAATVEAHTIDVPYASRTAYLEQLRRDMYEDYQALDVTVLAAGSVTATQIEAAYEPLNEKADMFEYCVLDFLDGIFRLAGIEHETASFNRSQMANLTEYTNMIMTASANLSLEMILKKLPFLTPDEVQEELDRNAENELKKRVPLPDAGTDDGEEEDIEDEYENEDDA